MAKISKLKSIPQELKIAIEQSDASVCHVCSSGMFCESKTGKEQFFCLLNSEIRFPVRDCSQFVLDDEVVGK